MDPFTCSRGDDPATAAAAHAQDPQLAFIAGGTDLSGLRQDRAAHPNRLLDINGVPDSAHINALPEGGGIQPRPATAVTAHDKEQVYEAL